MGHATRHISPAKRTIPGRDTELSVIIPAAGLGKRMKSKTPKALIDLGEDTLIERQLHSIWHHYPKAEILLIIGNQAERFRRHLKDYPIRFIFNPIFDTTNVAFSISLALQASTSHQLLLVYGDLIFNDESISHITYGPSKLLIDTSKNFDENEVGLIVDERSKITNLSYGLPSKWAQVAYLKDRELELFKQACYNENAVRWFGYEALNEVINAGGNLDAHIVTSSSVFDIDTPQHLEKAQLTVG